MFAIFQGNDFYSFWQNDKDDLTWIEMTVKKLKLSDVTIYFYEGLEEVPKGQEFDEDKKLQVKIPVIEDNGTTSPNVTWIDGDLIPGSLVWSQVS